MSYPANWHASRKAVRTRDEVCRNCGRDPQNHADLTFDVHHIVPRRWGGSNRLSNLALLCRDCHGGAHGLRMAPVVKFHSNGSMSADEFAVWEEYWANQDLARFNGEGKYWYIPVADVRYLT